MNAAWRARAILADPAGAWARIETEPGDAANLLTSYIVLLALIPTVFGFIGACVVGTIVPESVWCGRRSWRDCSARSLAM